MPQESSLYASGRVRSLEKGLISADRMMRIAENPLHDAMRLLQESGYGDMPEATAADCEKMIAREMEKAAKLVQEITPDEEVTDLFLMKADVHNLKALIKARLLGNTEVPQLMAGGVYEVEKLKQYVQESTYKELPEAFAEALTLLEKKLSAQVSSQLVSITLDRAYHAHARAVIEKRRGKNAFLSNYFYALADFNNVLALLRFREMGASREALFDMLLPEGDVAHSVLLNAMEQPLETLMRQVSTGRAGTDIARGLEEMQRTGHVSALEKARDNHLIRLSKQGKYEVMTIQPLIGFLLAREQEAKCIRLIITAKRNELDDGVIAERLREVYG